MPIILNTPSPKTTNLYTPPPLRIDIFKISIQERNLDKDIIAIKPPIQIQDSATTIYDQNGSYIATLKTERLLWLWNQFSQTNLPHLTNFLQPPPQDFETEILWLFQRYITIFPKKKNQKHMTIQPTPNYSLNP